MTDPEKLAALAAIGDPMERILADALLRAGVPFQHEGEGAVLDFYLPDERVHIEVKRMHSDRIASQMKRADDVIAAQGKVAIEWLASLLLDNAAMRQELQEMTGALVEARSLAKESDNANG